MALPLWKDRQVLVTGATGFIGSHLAERLVASGARVRVLVRNPKKLLPSLQDRVEVVAGDLLQPDSFAVAVAGREIIFHVAAWLGSPNRLDDCSNYRHQNSRSMDLQNSRYRRISRDRKYPEPNWPLQSSSTDQLLSLRFVRHSSALMATVLSKMPTVSRLAQNDQVFPPVTAFF